MGFSQTDTSKVCLPYSTAKLIAIDLVKYDSTTAELVSTKALLDLTESKVINKDNIINVYKDKEVLAINLLNNEIAKYQTLEIFNKSLIKDNRKLKTKNTFTKIISGLIIGGLGYFYINK